MLYKHVIEFPIMLAPIIYHRTHFCSLLNGEHQIQNLKISKRYFNFTFLFIYLDFGILIRSATVAELVNLI